MNTALSSVLTKRPTFKQHLDADFIDKQDWGKKMKW